MFKRCKINFGFALNITQWLKAGIALYVQVGGYFAYFLLQLQA